MNINKINFKLTNDYICGLIQADGSIGVKLHKTKNKLNIIPYFNITQNIKNKELIFQIKNYFNNVGYIHYIKKDKTIRYEVNSIKQLSNIIIPFLLKYDLRSNKHKKVLILEYILKILNLNLHLKNDNILLSLIILSKNLSKSKSKSNNIKYLNKQQQFIVNNNIYDNSIINYINELNLKINNYIPTDINLDYINGLFDGNGNISINLDNKYINLTYSIIQDNSELLLLNNIKKYYNNIGYIYKINNTSLKWETKNIHDISKYIINKIIVNNNFPLIKEYKFKHLINILNLLNNEYKINSNNELDVLKELYLIIDNKKQLSFEEFIRKIKEKEKGKNK